MKRCVRCIIPASYPGVTLNEAGVCSLCLSHRPLTNVDKNSRQVELDEIIRQIKVQNGHYDVLVPWSGGKDSTFVLYVMKKIYNLKVLALNYDNGFFSDFAKENIKNVSERLNVDVVILKPKWDLMRRMYAAFLRHRGEFCTVCNLVGYTIVLSFLMREKALQGYSPLVVGGWSSRYEAQRDIHTFDYGSFSEVLCLENGLLDEFESSPFVEKRICELLRRQRDPRVAIKYKDNMGLRAIQMPDYLTWNTQEIVEVLKEEAGWKTPEGDRSETHFDCIMHPVMKYLSIRRWGFAQDTVTLSAMIRDGMISRDEALQLVSKQNFSKPLVMEDLLSRLNITEDDINWTSTWYTGNNV